MKKANIYEVTVKADNGKTCNIHCIATNVNNVIDTVAAKRWNSESNDYYYINNITEENIINIMLKQSDVLVQDYINDTI